MADDIDIEEHDVLDNPVIRSIFPDITVIKKEISQYYDDVPNIKQEADIKTNNEKPSASYKISSNTDNCVKDVHKTAPQKLNPLKDTINNPRLQPKEIQSNKIILGSKPNNILQQTKYGEKNDVRKVHKISVESAVRVPKVILQDLGAYLCNNNRFCNDCQTLFSSRLDSDDHKRKVHCLKTRNKEVNVKVILEQTRNKCNICGSCFCNSGNLHRHYKNVHGKKMAFKSKYKNNRIVISTNDTSRATSNKLTRSQSKNIRHNAKNICFHCKKPFPDNKSLIEHIYKVLEPKRFPKAKMDKLSLNKGNHVTDTEKTEKKPTNLANNENQDILISKTFKDKLTFENLDSDASESQFSDVAENCESLETDMNQKKKESTSTTHQLKGKQVEKNINNNLQEEKEICSSRTLRNKRKHDNQAIDTSRSKSTEDNEFNVNIRSLGYKTLNKKLKYDIEKKKNEFSTSKYLDENCESHSNSEQKIKKQKLISPGLKTMKNKPAKNKKQQISMKPKSLSNENIKDKDNLRESVLNCEDNLNNKLIYECVYCTYIVPTAKAYYMHVVGKHKVEKILGANKVIFDEQCKFCPSKSTTNNGRNKHLYSYHYDLVYRNEVNPNEVKERKDKNTTLRNPAFKMFESFVLESIIYKCNKCDIHFLSSCIAKDHEKHMELLINWKCSICRRIFKKHDKHLHLKQHNFSKTLNVCQFNESELSRLLYNCTKCAIHFTEERYLEHYSKCEDETADSAYCTHCDILVDKHGFKSHENYHKMGKTISDFTVIVADIIEMPKSVENNVVKKRTRLYEQVNCLTFCPTCKCYLTDIGLTRKTHTESRCSKITKYTCNLCGLVLTNKAMGTHRENHKKINNLKLQDFKFFDLKGIQITPPIPEYPRCDNCEVIFVSRNAVLSHICSEIEYLNCNVCNIKLSENAFKLHMNFHSYSILKAGKDTSQANVPLESREQQIEPDKHKVIANPSSNTPIQKEVTIKHVIDESTVSNIVYSCQVCKITVNTYDKVIEHCQNHFSPVPTIATTLKICSKCSLKFETEAFEVHQKLHLRYDTIQLVTFDPTYFTSDNRVWIKHIFATVPQLVQKEIITKSIYRHECRIKMEIAQKGPPYLTVYKCSKCSNFIDEDCLFAHVKDTCSKSVRKYPCSMCGLPFMANSFRSKHEEIHKRYDNARLKLYNIVLINCEAHQSYNTSILNAVKQYVLYQCRICEGIVDKLQRNVHQCNVNDLEKCPICGLLLYKDDYERHISKHIDLAMFITTNMKVILFGDINNSDLEKTLSPGFVGMVHDYRLYKCVKCEVCVNNEVLTSRHTCTSDDSKWKCPKCGYYICARFSLKSHIKMHDTDSEFRTENIRLVYFGTKDTEINSNETNEKMVTVHGENDSIKNEHVSNADCKISKTEPESVSLFKCACGLHYMDKFNADNHVKHCGPKIKVIRQTCSKCSLVFNPTELFSHIIKHHGDKNKTFTYEIIELSTEYKKE